MSVSASFKLAVPRITRWMSPVASFFGDEIRRLLELALGLGNDDDVPERRDRGRDRGFVLQVRRLHRDAQLAQVEQLGRARPGSEHALRVRAVNLVRAGRGALLALLVAKVRDSDDHV
jgi:hypothetical protein